MHFSLWKWKGNVWYFNILRSDSMFGDCGEKFLVKTWLTHVKVVLFNEFRWKSSFYVKTYYARMCIETELGLILFIILYIYKIKIFLLLKITKANIKFYGFTELIKMSFINILIFRKNSWQLTTIYDTGTDKQNSDKLYTIITCVCNLFSLTITFHS